MEYTFEQLNETMYELKVGTFIFLLDSEETIHAQMISDFQDKANIERFIDLLNADPSVAYNLYNGVE
jgi:hypothetical protein